MKLKYYLRGLGIGIIVTTIILVSCFSMQKPKMTDEQIIEKAAQLGMIMPEQNSAVIAETETTEPEETEQKNEQQIAAEKLQQETGVIAAAYFGMQILSNIFELIQTSSIWPTVFQSIIYLLCIVVIVGYYFQTRRISPIPVYCVATFNLIRSVVMYFQMLQLENGFAFIVRTIWLIAVVGYMGLMAYQAYSLEKKWRLAVK